VAVSIELIKSLTLYEALCTIQKLKTANHWTLETENGILLNTSHRNGERLKEIVHDKESVKMVGEPKEAGIYRKRDKKKTSKETLWGASMRQVLVVSFCWLAVVHPHKGFFFQFH